MAHFLSSVDLSTWLAPLMTGGFWFGFFVEFGG